MRVTGTMKFFNTAKGFGFVQPDDGSKDVFVHATALEAAGIRSLNERQDQLRARRRPARPRQASWADREGLNSQ
jgi:cold shock CspA family protein